MEGSVLGKRSQSEDKYPMILLICGAQQNKTREQAGLNNDKALALDYKTDHWAVEEGVSGRGNRLINSGGNFGGGGAQ